jgi:hypothetical protein
MRLKGAAMSELEEFKKVVSPIAYGLAYKSELGTTEYQQLYAEEDVIKYFNNKPSFTIQKSIADILDNVFNSFTELQNNANSLMIQTIYTHYEPETTFYKWFNKEDNSYNISIIYLAGKALGVDLVKVGEND